MSIEFDAGSIFLLVYCLFGLLIFSIGILGTIFWIWMIVDCVTNEVNVGNEKLMWILIIALTHFIGAAIYYFARRPTRKRLLGH